MDKATLGFRIYKIWQILNRFAGTFHRAQTLKLGGVSLGVFTITICNMAAVSPTPTIEVITSEPKPSINSKEDNNCGDDITSQFVGLEELNNTDKIVVQQMTGLIAGACCCGYEGENMFEISDRLGRYIH